MEFAPLRIMKSQQEILDQIKDYADKAHGDQMRKYAPDRYIVHPERVMKMCKEYTDDISILAAALLHDVLEDTPVSADEMSDYLHTILPPAAAKKTLEMVVDLTDVFISADYPGLNRRARKMKELERLMKTHPDSQTIKYADIIDNTKEIVVHDRHFAGVFLRECKVILDEVSKGNPDLREKAIATVNAGLQVLGKKK